MGTPLCILWECMTCQTVKAGNRVSTLTTEHFVRSTDKIMVVKPGVDFLTMCTHSFQRGWMIVCQ